jgi:hypothetical protein
VKWFASAVVATALLGACAEDAPKFLSSIESSSPAGEGGDGASAAVPGESGAPNGDGGAKGGAVGRGNAGDNGEPGAVGGSGDAGAAGESGGAAGSECTPDSLDEDCPGEECFIASCVAGRCHYDPAGARTECGAERERYCNGEGACLECLQDSHCNSNGACSVGDCTPEGTCDLQLLEAGEDCDDGVFCNGDEECDGRGVCDGGDERCAEPTVCDEQERQCVGCRADSDCPAATPTCSAQGSCICTSDEDCEVTDECRIGLCNRASGTCSVENRDPGTLVGEQIPGDCRARRCNDGGAAVMVDDDADLPADPGAPCTRPACQAGAVVSALRAENTPCGDAGTECSSEDTCDAAGNCRPNHLSSGTVIRGETGIDCRRRTCDGDGNAVETPIDAACQDGLFCTGTDACDSSGVCQHSGDPCINSAFPYCVGTACHACIADSECPSFTPTRTGRCIGGTCRQCTDATVVDDCGGQETGCNAGICYATCDCMDEACNRRYPDLC